MPDTLDPYAVGAYAPPPDQRTTLMAAARTLAAELRARPDASAARFVSMATRLEALADEDAPDELSWRYAIAGYLTTHDAWLFAAESGGVRPLLEDWADVPGRDADGLRAILTARMEEADRARRLVHSLLAYGHTPAPREPLGPMAPRPAALVLTPTDCGGGPCGRDRGTGRGRH